VLGIRETSGSADGDSGSSAACSWTVLENCPPDPQTPCVPGSGVTASDGGLDTACNTCFTTTCGAAWDCCGSDPALVEQSTTTFPACLVLTQCVDTDLHNGETLATALPSCESANSYSPESESVAEALIVCLNSKCASVCP
jgi:hypothetical protein